MAAENRKVEFGPNQIEEFARFLAELERQNIEYIVHNYVGGGWYVLITGH